MIGVFDSGHGGLTILQALTERMPHKAFIYYGDHARAPYGDKPHDAIVTYTQEACNLLFEQGCSIVIMACNTATAVAGRTLQQNWLNKAWPGRKILGIIAPTVEAVTQTPWYVQAPVFPQKYNTDTVALFATSATVSTNVYGIEIEKRCPDMRLISQACPGLVPLIEQGDPNGQLPTLVNDYVKTVLTETNAKTGKAPEWAILGCTHFPLIAHLFRAALPPETRIMNQPMAVAWALEDYLSRHPELSPLNDAPGVRYLTSGDAETVRAVAKTMLGRTIAFEKI